MDGSDNDAGESRRWTCEACGCNTNSEIDRACSICGTSNGASLLRRAGYAARSGLFPRSFQEATRRRIALEDLGMEGYELWDRSDADAEMLGGEDEYAIAALAMEVAGVSGRDPLRQQSVLEAARSFAMATRTTHRTDPTEILRAACDNSSFYQPKWIDPSQIGDRIQTGNGIEVANGVAHLPLGAGEGRALRAKEALTRGAPFASFNLASTNGMGQDRRPKRAFGFRVAFEHPSKESGKKMGGCYLVGVTTSSFTAFGERNALQQSPFFWGIDDSGNKYEGSRSHSSREGRSVPSSYAIELSSSEAPRNADNALFGSRESVTCVVDLDGRSLTFWRDEELLGTLVTNLPRGGNLYPVVVPYNAGTTAAITGMGGDPSQVLRSFSTDSKQAQQEKDMQRRKELASQRLVLIQNKKLAPGLVKILHEIFVRYSGSKEQNTQLKHVEAVRLWYRCGLTLSNLDTLIQDKKKSQPIQICFDDFLEVLSSVIREEEHSMDGQLHHSTESHDFQIGDKVELVEGYERFGDATSGPLHPGDRGMVIDFRTGPTGDRHSIRVVHNSLRWWYQPQALLREKSGLTESAGVWFLRTILRAHGYDHTTLQFLVGSQVTTSSWCVGDVVAPKTVPSGDATEVRSEGQTQAVMDLALGRIVAESADSTATLTSRGRESGSVLVEFISKKFSEATGIQTGSAFQDASLSLKTQRIPVDRLVHSSVYGECADMKPSRNTCNSSMEDGTENRGLEAVAIEMLSDEEDGGTVIGNARSDIKKIADLDVFAIENVSRECTENTTALAAMFNAGLQDSILAAIDAAARKVKGSEDAGNLAQAISALGKLVLIIAKQAFLHDFCEAQHVSGRTDSEVVRKAIREKQQSGQHGKRSAYQRTRTDERGTWTLGLSDSTSSQEVGHVGRLSSLQQRRSMLNALISRARRDNPGSVSDILNGAMCESSEEESVTSMVAPLSPNRPDGPSLLFNQRSGYLHRGSWDESIGETHDGVFSSANDGTAPKAPPLSRNILRRKGANDIKNERSSSVLDAILRGRAFKPHLGSYGRKSPGFIQLSVRKSLISNGLQGNSLQWLKAALDPERERISVKQSQRNVALLQSSTDDDGMPLLQLAISLGCSSSIISHLIRLGAPICEKEIKLAARMDQPSALYIMLRNSVYSEGLVDIDSCSPAVANVIREASVRQKAQQQKMRLEAGSFLASFLQKMLLLGLSCRRHSFDLCGRAVIGSLLGNTVLAALRKRQKQTIPTESERATNTYIQDGWNIQSRGAQTLEGMCVVNSSHHGLLRALPDEVLGECLVDNPVHFTTLLLLIEDYLYRKEINDSTIGVTLLLILLKRYPSLHLSSEVERYGLTELLSWHDSLASNQLASISSRAPEQESPRGTVTDSKPHVAPDVVLCPKGHTAALHVTRHSSFRCDKCGKGVERGRVMHGCRKCDWDACERCTDKAEGGVLKWNYMRESICECHNMLAGAATFTDESVPSNCPWREKLVENLISMDTSSDVKNLSIRILRRDRDSMRKLESMLSIPGQLTMHQFLNVILPALHAALVGKPSGNGRVKLARVSSSRRSKKPRMIKSRSRDSEGGLHADVYEDEDRQEFAREVLKYLGTSQTTYGDINSHDGGAKHNKARREDSNHDGDQEMGGDGLDIDEGKYNQDQSHSVTSRSEFLRRLHQVIALHENVATPPKIHYRLGYQSSKGGDLQSLTKPIELCLLPLGPTKQPENQSKNENVLKIHVEPLMSIEDLSLHILRSCKVVQPNYLAFCRRLAANGAVIIERPLERGRRQGQWKIAKVVAYDEENCWHSVRYASNFTGPCKERLELNPKTMSDMQNFQFDSEETKLMLTARAYYVLSRDLTRDEGQDKSAFGMEHFTEDGVGSDAYRKSRNPKHPSVGTRVESNFSSTEWQPYTVLSVKSSKPAGIPMQDLSYVLVSDEGNVICAVPPRNIRGLDDDDGKNSEDFVSGGSSARGSEGRGQMGRSFPFLTVRRQAIEGQRADTFRMEKKFRRVLKRRWSALSPIEKMCPIEMKVNDFKRPIPQQECSLSDTYEWRCSVGSREFDISLVRSAAELPPQLRIWFSLNQMESPLELTPKADTTLISFLLKLYKRINEPMAGNSQCEIFYLVTCGPTNLQQTDSESSLLSRAFAASDTVADKSEARGLFSTQGLVETENGTMYIPRILDKSSPLSTTNRTGKSIHLSSHSSEDGGTMGEFCDGLDEACVQCMEIVGLLADLAHRASEPKQKIRSTSTIFENKELSRKLMEQLEDPLTVVGGALPQWCFAAPSFAPRLFSYKSRRLLLELGAFGVSRSALRQQESKVNVGHLRHRMASLRARAVELVGEAFSSGAEDPTALQLQADELYGMEEALAARVKAAFRAERWDEHSLQVAKVAVHRNQLISDAISVMHQYANDTRICRRRLEVRFDGESGFDAASGNEAGVTRGFYADVAEALLSCDIAAGVSSASLCPNGQGAPMVTSMVLNRKVLQYPLPLWIPDVDASGQIIIPTPRADPNSGLGVYPRPLSNRHPQFNMILDQFRFMGRLFAAALRDGFMFPLPLSSAFLKLVQYGRKEDQAITMQLPVQTSRWMAAALNRPILSSIESEASVGKGGTSSSESEMDRQILLTSADLPRPGFLGGEVYAVDIHICRALDRLDQIDPPLNQTELEQRYREIARDSSFARSALGRSYDCSFEEYFQDRTFVDPFDPTQGIEATPLCPNGHRKNVTIDNIREYVILAKLFILHDGVLPQALAFRQGVNDFFPASYLRLFAPEELQSDVCGVGDNVDNWDESAIRKLFKLDGGKGDAEALVAVAAIGGEGGAALSRRFGPNSATINFMVKALFEASPKMRRQFLSFVTSVPIVTPGRIEVVPLVSPSGDFLPMRDPGCLPRANTCARRLYLPKFQTYESFSHVFWAVVGEECKFKGFYEWRGS